MIDDKAMAMPGETGWLGSDGDRRIFDQAAAEEPQLYSRRPAQEPHPESLTAVEGIMRTDGIDGGCWLQAIERYVFGSNLAWLPQRIGSCVGSSWMRLTTIRTLWESFVLRDPEEVWGTSLVGTNNVAPFGPYGYRAGRKIAGINGGDGSYCSAQVKGAQQYGMLPCSTPGLVSDAFPEPQDMSTYRRMGNSDQFLNQYAAAAGKHKLLETERVTSADDAKVLICEHFKPLQICSMWAFRPDRQHPSWRLGNGEEVVIYRRDNSTSWAHAMSIVGFVSVGGSWYVIVLNSWGNSHRNGQWFVISADLFHTWLQSAECYSVGDIELTDNVLPGD